MDSNYNETQTGGQIFVEKVEAPYPSPRPVERPTSEEIGQKAAGLVNIQDIIAVRQMPKKELYIPAWKGFIVIQALTRKQAEQVREDSMVTDAQGNRVPDKSLSERVMLKASVVQPRFTSEQV